MAFAIEAARLLRRSGLNAVVAAGAITAMLVGAPSALAQPWSASTLPADGNIAGTAGERIGWGYRVDNPDAANWLVLTDIAADAFQQAVAEVLFDLPIVGPGGSQSMAFSGSNGLYALTWNAGATPGFVNVGSFVLDAQWWSGDPLAGGQLLGAAPSVSLSYSAVVTVVPEAAPQVMLLLGLAALALCRLRAVTAA